MSSFSLPPKTRGHSLFASKATFNSFLVVDDGFVLLFCQVVTIH